MTILELIGTILSLLSIYLAARQWLVTWPLGITSCGIYIYFFYHHQLYADTGLWAFYLAMNCYGWYEWLHGGVNNKQLSVSKATHAMLYLYILLGAMGTVLLWQVLKHTDSDVPLMDALLTSFSLVATYMVTRKHLQNWLLWIPINILYIGLYVYKGAYITSLQNLVLIILSVYGYLEWKGRLKPST